MRLTNKIIHRRMLNGLQKAKDRMIKSQERISTRRNIKKPSDDPIGFMKIMSYHRDLHQVRQTVKNAKSAAIMLSQTDVALEQAGELMLKARNTAAAMATDTVDPDTRLAMVNDIQLIIDDMLQKANTKIGGRYIFSGHKIFTAPYQMVNDQIEYVGDLGRTKQRTELSKSMDISVPGPEAFGPYDIAGPFSFTALDATISGGSGLDDGITAEELETAFANNGITLPANATVETIEANQRWRIIDDDKAYYVENYDAGTDDNRLRIYTYTTASFAFTALDETVSGSSGLNNNIIAEELNTEFANNGITLSEDAAVTIVKANERWRINDNGVTYSIENYDAGADNNRLRIYPESYAVDSGVFGALTELKNGLETNNVTMIRNSMMLIDENIDRITGVRAQVGVKVNRAETSIAQLNSIELSLTNELSDVQDVDMVMGAGEYMASQEAYQAALEATASTLKLPSLLDYLR